MELSNYLSDFLFHKHYFLILMGGQKMNEYKLFLFLEVVVLLDHKGLCCH